MRSVIVLSGPLLAAALALVSAAPARANIIVVIDKSTQSMSVAVDGAPRYVWPVSTGRAGYDTPNGTFRPNRMDADHLSQEWDNAPMPHAVFFDMNGHAIHGFFDVKHLGLAVSHGCVRLSPEHAATLFDLIKAEGMNATTVVVSGRTPAAGSPDIARRRAPAEPVAAQPLEIAPGYGQQQGPYYGQQQYYSQQAQPYYYGQQQTYYRQAPPAYAQQPPAAQPAYGQPAYPPQPPPPQVFPFRLFAPN